MITCNNWPKRWEEVPAWTEIDEEVYNHFLNVLPPLCWNDSYFQCSEPFDFAKDENGRFGGLYLTFDKRDGKFFYLGINFRGQRPKEG